MSEAQDDSEWMMDIDRKRYGPYQRAKLVEWVQGGKIVPQAVIRNGMQQFTPAQFLAQFGMSTPLTPQVSTVVAPVTNASPGAFHELPVVPVPIDEFQQPAKPLPTSGLPAVKDLSNEPMASASCDADNDEVFERDQIVVIGRRRSGKTIFLASIYGKLWKSLDGMTAKALTGETHRELIEINRMLKQGQWPGSTVGTTQVAMELEYHHRKRLLVALDYAGEKFSDAFVKENMEDPVVKELLKHIDRAAAVILLIDPSAIAGGDMDALIDDDFGMVQAVQRIRNWPGGDSVPIVLVLTKMDMHQGLIDQSGGVKEFVRQHFPALVRMLKEIPIFQVSAVQVDRTADGTLKPRPDSALINIEKPLRYCLSKIDTAEKAVLRQQNQEEQQRQVLQMELEEQRLEQKHKRFWAIIIVAMIVVGLGVIALMIVFQIG